MPVPVSDLSYHRSWWHRPKPYSHIELICDGLVHGLGLLIALVAGGVLVFGASKSAPEELGSVFVYVAALVTVLVVSLAFNMAPIAPIKRLLARLDQAAIFLLIAGTYTPMLALLNGTPVGELMLIGVWSGALIGIALKLIVPQHFGRLALFLYAGIGWSGLLIFQSLAAALTPSTLWLLLAGGVAYSSGIIFHVWERLNFITSSGIASSYSAPVSTFGPCSIAWS